MPPEKVNGVPRLRWDHDTFASFDLKANPAMQAARDRCEAIAAGREWCALLSGSSGNGKTHLAIAAMHVFAGGNRAYFWKVTDFLEWVRATAYGESLGVLGTLKSYVEQDFLLVLDDLGVERATEWADEQLYRVLDARYDMRLPTIITTNQDPERIDGRLLSRFASGLVPCGGSDYRRRKGA